MSDSRPADLDDTQRAWDAVVADPRFPAAPPSFRADLLNRSAVVRQWRGARDSSAGELARALTSFGEALDIAVTSTERALYLHNAAMTRLLGFELAGTVGELDAALDLMRAAMSAAADDVRLRPLAHCGTADVLFTRFRTTGARADIEEAVDLAGAAVDEALPDSPRAARYRATLGRVLSFRYDAFGSIDDLDRGIALWTSADGQLERGGSAVLGPLLRRRWCAKRDRRDLESSIIILRRAVQASAPGDRPANLTNLGSALLDRYQETGDLEDVRGAVEAHELSAHETSDGDWQRASRHNNVGNSLIALYGRTNAAPDLERAIRQYEIAVAVTTPGAQERASREYNLGNARRAMWERTHGQADAAAATNAYRAACETGLVTGLEWALAAARTWGAWAAERAAWADAADAAGWGIEAIDELFRRQLVRDDKETWLTRASGLPSLAALALCASGRPGAAVVALERGRAFLLSEAIERARLDLAELEKAGHGDLTARYRAATDALRAANE